VTAINRLIGEGDFKVIVAVERRRSAGSCKQLETRLYALASLVFLDGLASSVLSLCIFLALVDPVLLGIAW